VLLRERHLERRCSERVLGGWGERSRGEELRRDLDQERLLRCRSQITLLQRSQALCKPLRCTHSWSSQGD
jgi:hypothetical protein